MNRADDVLLVRYLLRRANQVPKYAGPYASLPLVSTYDKELSAAILDFQKRLKSMGKPIGTDGNVDQAPNGDGRYTINYLYGIYYLYYPEFRGDLTRDPQCPPALQQVNQIYANGQ